MSVDSVCESLWKKMTGKSRLMSGFDEGELEIGHPLLRQFPTLPGEVTPIARPIDQNPVWDLQSFSKVD